MNISDLVGVNRPDKIFFDLELNNTKKLLFVNNGRFSLSGSKLRGRENVVISPCRKFAREFYTHLLYLLTLLLYFILILKCGE